MRVHLLGVPHTITHRDYSHDAFTNKVRTMAPMLRAVGYDVVHYGVEGSDSGATTHIEVLGHDEFYALLGHRHEDPTRFHAQDANVGNAVYRTFNARLRDHLARNVARGDVVLHPIGIGHRDALGSHVGVDCEMGIGYPESYLPFRIFESSAWMHYHQAKFQREPSAYEWVIPASFDVSEWPLQEADTDRPYVAFLGRISHTKGCHVIAEVAKRMPELRFVLCGQGDPTPFLTSPNVEYLPPITGTARAKFLGKAVACLYPSQYAEPFGQTPVEAMLCGTPAVVTPWGAYLETVQHGITGYHCRVLQDFVTAIQRAPTLSRAAIRARTVATYGMEAVAPLYDHAIAQLSAYGRGEDWYHYAGTLSSVSGMCNG
jgi:glycosyltransferase involved in cell wall biosynthesis